MRYSYTVANTRGFSPKREEIDVALKDGIGGQFYNVSVIASTPRSAGKPAPRGFALRNLDEALVDFYAAQKDDPGLRI